MAKEKLGPGEAWVLEHEEAFDSAEMITKDPGAAGLLLLAGQIAEVKDELIKLCEILDRLQRRT